MPGPDDRAGAIARVARCVEAMGSQAEDIEMALEIVARKNGPYLVTGDLRQLELRDGDGNLYDLGGQSRVFLCRCGGSTNKPFCDGQHSKIGFQAAEAAVAESG